MKRRTGRTRREREGGFALLLVFVMAAVAAIALYMELPRVAFDIQRQKEQLLMERGQQYQMAIRRYMQRGLKQGVNQVVGPPWPARIEDLEDTNGRRFLRKRYLDPMTGTDEWRIIHINNGVLTDSINNKPQQNNQQQEGLRQGGITEFASMMDQAAGARSATNPGQARRRPSDSAGSGGGGTGDANASGNPGDSGAQPAPNPLPVPPQTGAGLASGSGNAGQGGAFGTPMPPGIPPGQPSYPGQLGAAVNSNVQPNSPFVNGPNPNGNPSFFPQPGTTMGQISPQQLIGNLLTQPRPGGMPTAVPNANSTIGGGIAGVASKLDDDSIMTCGDHTNYAEWEFIFDPSKWKGPADPRKALVGTPAGSGSSSGSSAGPGMGTPVGGAPGMGAPGVGGPGMGAPGMSGPGGPGAPSFGSSPAANQNRGVGGAQGGNFGTICGMEARPGIQ
jgi:type II secretory pathway pseudopilin PulG